MLRGYALNNFSTAFRALANKGLGKKRWLCGKYVEHLCDLDEADIPDSLKEDFARFKLDMRMVQKRCRGENLRMTVQVMSESEVNEVVARILAMHEALVHEASVDLLARRTGGWSTPFDTTACPEIAPPVSEDKPGAKGQP